MSTNSLKIFARVLKIQLVICLVALISISTISFTSIRLADDFLKQLGISKSEADKKIANSILGGYMNLYGVSTAKNIALGNRTAVTKELLAYTKKYIQSEAFKKEYLALKHQHQPEQQKIQTPEEMQADMIKQYKKSVADMENTVKQADATNKPIFEKVLADARKMLADAASPNNPMITNYRKNYPQALKSNEEAYAASLTRWEKEYPSNHLAFVQRRLEAFLDYTKDIDFSAALVTKNGKQVFANPAYEHQNNYWKMGFRAGREVVEPARAFAQQWLTEIKGSSAP